MSSNTQPTLWKTEHTVPGRPVFGAQHPPLSSKLSNKKPVAMNTIISKKIDQEKFHEYAINTDDAWEIDDRIMTLKMLDNDSNNGHDNDYPTQLLSISKQTVDEVASRVIQEHKSKSQSNKLTLDASAVRRPALAPHTSSTTCPGIGRRIGDYPNIKPLVPIRYTNNDDHNNNNNNNNNHSNSSLAKIIKTNSRPNLIAKLDIDIQKENKFKPIFEQTNIDLNELRKASWNGIPKQYRAQAWKLLCGYLPPKVERREDTLTRKRDEYWSYVSQYYHTRTESEHQDTFRQLNTNE
ncbi:unnamed protein product [Rotaria magnacalcarata]|uniref:Uncharacterized protein n=1 Tax=Rotaria magnacalcarata TaxID=392030 RepID=A0A818YSG5_9BILA|nr:unnamed protein product [Rotaria magnacalcarata]